MTDHKGYEQLDPNIFPAHVLYAPPRVWRSNDSYDDPMTLFFFNQDPGHVVSREWWLRGEPWEHITMCLMNLRYILSHWNVRFSL